MTADRLIARLQKLMIERGYLINRQADLIRQRKSSAHVRVKLQGVTTKILQCESKLERVA